MLEPEHFSEPETQSVGRTFVNLPVAQKTASVIATNGTCFFGIVARVNCHESSELFVFRCTPELIGNFVCAQRIFNFVKKFHCRRVAGNVNDNVIFAHDVKNFLRKRGNKQAVRQNAQVAFREISARSFYVFVKIFHKQRFAAEQEKSCDIAYLRNSAKIALEIFERINFTCLKEVREMTTAFAIQIASVNDLRLKLRKKSFFGLQPMNRIARVKKIKDHDADLRDAVKFADLDDRFAEFAAPVFGDDHAVKFTSVYETSEFKKGYQRQICELITPPRIDTKSRIKNLNSMPPVCKPA